VKTVVVAFYQQLRQLAAIDSPAAIACADGDEEHRDDEEMESDLEIDPECEDAREHAKRVAVSEPHQFRS
jgi:hypothetical protein